MNHPARSSTAAWVVYDLANTIFALGVVGLYFPDWMVIRGIPDSRLAVVEAAAGVLVVVGAPWVGARSDHRRRRVPALVVTTLVTVAATSFLGIDPIWVSLLALGVALVAVNIGSVVYDALLPVVSTPETRGRVSGLGVGIGYVGSFIGLAIGLITLDVQGWSHAATFRLLGLAFLLFAIPTFVSIAEPVLPSLAGRPPGLRSILTDLGKSWRRAGEHQGVVRFLVGRFLYTDAINTLVGGFLAIYAIQELGFDRSESRNLLGGAILAAIVGGLAGGRLVDRFGPLRVLRVALVGWMVAIAGGVAAAFTDLTALSWVIGPVAGVSLGATWTADRVVMVRVSPTRHLGEFYGLYATVGRFATILGPLVWGLVVDGLGWGRPVALGALGIFVAAGWVVLARVDDRVRVWPDEPSLNPDRS